MSEGGRKSKKPIVWFVAAKKGFVLNKTNGRTIAGLYGTDTTKWVGKSITIYPTVTKFGKQDVDCIRVRPVVPTKPGETAPPESFSEPTQPPEKEPTE